MNVEASSPSRRIEISKGFDIPIAGSPETKVVDGPKVTSVALLGDDYLGMKPTMAVQEGDSVKLGQVVFVDKKSPTIRYTAPAAGRVSSIVRGAKRKFESLTIEVEGDSEVEFTSYSDFALHKLDREKVLDTLSQSGLWSSLRARPYGKVARPDTQPHSIFVTAMDTDPLAPDPSLVLLEHDHLNYLDAGLQVLSVLSEGKVYLCTAPGAKLPELTAPAVETVEFAGPHPAGLAGTHIHFLDPVDENKVVWQIGYQDVTAIGHLFMTGKLLVSRVISLAGPVVNNPQVIRTRLGASISDLTTGRYDAGNEVRVISGSVLSGRTVTSTVEYLGRYHTQISILAEGRQRKLLGWKMPGFKKLSVTRAFASAIKKLENLPLTTSTEGSVRAIVPIGTYEKVMPLDILATPLLKSLLVQDTDTALMLGCLELLEEDLALCTFACPGKNNYASLLRRCLNHIESEG